MHKKIIPLILAGLMAISQAAMAAPSRWAQEEVTAARKAGLVPKTLQSDYQKAITREEFCEIAMLFWCKLTEKEMPTATATFTDTENPSVSAAQSLGIVKGESATQFSPANPVTRQEICVMLQRAMLAANPEAKLPAAYPNTFPDADSVADWAIEAVQCMNLFAVMLGDENGNIQPLGHTTREQAILLAYRLLVTQSLTMQEFVEKYIMPIDGNSYDNMLNGAFAVCMANGTTYFSGNGGIKSGTAAVITEKAARNTQAFADALYYIGGEGALYTFNLSTRTEEKLADGDVDLFGIVGTSIFYRDTAEGKIYKMPLDTKAKEVYIDEKAELPIFAGETVFYTNGEGIYKLQEGQTAEKVFSGQCRNLCYRNDYFYFINGSGLLCRTDLNGANYKVLSKLPLTQFAFTRDCLVVLAQEGGFVYKVDYDGRYTIKLDTDTYMGINTYDDYVYARTAEGDTWKFSNNGTEKAKIN